MLVKKIIVEDFMLNQTGVFPASRKVPDEFIISSNDKKSVFELFLSFVPGGVSIAVDVSCEKILHNPRAAQFLRINDFEDFSHSAVQPPPVKVLNNGKELSADEMPIQQAAKNDRGIYEVELEFIWKDGVRKVALWNARPIHDEGRNVIGVIATFEEITKQKQIEKELLASEERFRAMFENSPNAIMLTRPQGSILDVNPAGCDIFGWTKEELCTMGWTGILAINDIKTINVIMERNKTGNIHSELTFLRKDGARFEGEISSKLFKNGEGELLGIVIIRDISERKKAEQIISQSEEKFSKIFHGGPIMMTLATIEEGKFIDVNDALCTGTGYTREDLIGCTTKELNFFVDMGQRWKRGKTLIEQGKIEADIDFRTKSGEVRQGHSWSQLIYLNDQPCHITGLIDITEQKLLEQEMARLDRLNLVGQMAAGIGHEVRNPMTTVRGYLQLLSSKKEVSEYKETFDLMIEELDRANSIITNYLSVANNKIIELEMAKINEIVENILPLMKSNATLNDIYIDTEIEEVSEIPLDKKEINQIIINLVQNAIQATPYKGIVKIRTYENEEEVVFSVQDEGKGIPKEMLEKIGTPFFTTKENGTGLGLAVCYSIAQRHNAKIDIQTGSNGTTFWVKFKKIR
ncbi:MAG: PAS domain S-box protein [Bacillota bacterium]|nr:PAS domain S-box protein [Bacillota bacterium]